MRTIICMIATVTISTLVLAAPQKNKSAHGEEIFQQMCSGCHGPDGRAQTDMGKSLQAADLTSDAVQHLSTSEISKQVQKGKGKMPGFEGKLSDDEIKAVVAYVQELGKKP